MKLKINIDMFLQMLGDILLLSGIATLVVILWQSLELAILNKITPDKVDTIIALILSYSLYWNYKMILNKKEQK